MNKQNDKELSYEELLKKSDEYLNGWKRALADYHNLERETAKKKSEWLKMANEQLLVVFLPVYDHLKLALKHSQAEKGDWLAGIEHVTAQFKKVLEENGVTEIKTVGEEFDPEIHEVIKKESDKNIITREIKAGYKLNGKVLYPAKVIL
ncbi:nucleotide exchange factor GrpE [Candidatus Kuenenbacteria bacterium CG_4_9_14_3_um_filter_39_14]|uniref:Protein GrpE n=7 Tax=Candidatus Kueneniibacteriota TaxID=1752740 RepID=A0A2M7IM51_9BACT|nr:nucleotide exchange factor GrpE [Candidatus Kuenenbacteria bacterium]OIP56709.1 MAG: nucleotide exchange factor GrpE [Candidatus Kuenenbacteria bacterium CG2_30_39_24]PIP28800.1 MAG: nucleotide exchange factor GrpE [Candidatus Kuenenbacteria bacterium CG23_combo_of_CG06-09_8_20_14_all_39_39]PIP75335.1 MAG: nucleotide exchange factor GrpE [Candidatus Kuenenbacteria bacterium CG22_combo_CG10-13_8_21_14_all_39_9]PIR80620.1 MAG: nucleotide exchange factor GrpE [Candidatus Kuenenbacteria bacteriu